MATLNKPWYELAIRETLDVLQSRRSGLGEAEARTRRLQYGPNEMQRPQKTHPAMSFLKQFINPMIYVMLIAAIISLALRRWLDAGVIIGVLFVNAIIGYIQESQAEHAMEALLEMTAPQAKVRRDGTTSTIPARDIVPGDIVILETGDRIPADARLVEVSNLKVNEAVLTGESLPAEKHTNALRGEAPVAERKNMVHLGTIVSFGRATAVVVATGMSTEMGRIAQAIEQIKPEKTPLQKSISRLSRYLVIVLLSIVALLAIVGVLRGLPAQQVWLIAVAAAVSAIPESLPAVVTIVLALGMRAMAHRRALIRKLVAVEGLGSATVICTDKTGTLTKNEMTVRRIVLSGRSIEISGEGLEPKGEFRLDGQALKPTDNQTLMLLLRIGILCNDALLSASDSSYSILGDPTEGALVVAAGKAGLVKEKLQTTYPRLDEIPFQSEKLYMATLHPYDGRRVAYVKGAPEKLLSLTKSIVKDGQVVPLTDADAQAIRESNTAMASEAMRVIAFAYADLPPDLDDVEDVDMRGNLVFVGLAGIDDPPREEAIRAVALCREAGIKVVMITGDNRVTAESVARQLGLPPGKAVVGSEVASMSDRELARQVEDISIFARVEPLHKLRIISALKGRGHVVAMTGDGVNDAPALKAADIGIAMGIKGTDVAKEASDVVLADDNFASIVAAVDEGRAIFARLRNVIFFLLSTNIGELFGLLLSLIFVGKAPLLAVQIIWANLLTDTAVGLPLGLEPKVGDELKQPPRHPSVGLLFRGQLFRIAFLAGMMSLGMFAMFRWAYNSTGDMEYAQTMAFCTLVAFEWFRALNARSDEHTVLKLGFFRNRYLIGAIALAVSLQMIVIYLPPLRNAFGTVALEVEDWAMIVGAAGSLFLVEELRKVVAPRLFSKGKWAPA